MLALFYFGGRPQIAGVLACPAADAWVAWVGWVGLDWIGWTDWIGLGGYTFY